MRTAWLLREDLFALSEMAGVAANSSKKSLRVALRVHASNRKALKAFDDALKRRMSKTPAKKSATAAPRRAANNTAQERGAPAGAFLSVFPAGKTPTPRSHPRPLGEDENAESDEVDSEEDDTDDHDTDEDDTDALLSDAGADVEKLEKDIALRLQLELQKLEKRTSSAKAAKSRRRIKQDPAAKSPAPASAQVEQEAAPRPAPKQKAAAPAPKKDVERTAPKSGTHHQPAHHQPAVTPEEVEAGLAPAAQPAKTIVSKAKAVSPYDYEQVFVSQKIRRTNRFHVDV